MNVPCSICVTKSVKMYQEAIGVLAMKVSILKMIIRHAFVCDVFP